MSPSVQTAVLREPRNRPQLLAHDSPQQHEPQQRPSEQHDDLFPLLRSEMHEQEPSIGLPAGTRHAEDTVMPFLAEHIPNQYNPVGMASSRSLQQTTSVQEEQHRRTSTKFCYRHEPDTKCRRQANEPDMEELQDGLAALSQSDQQAISHVWALFSAAPSKHRELMLQGLLRQCCFPQLSYISATVRDLIKIDFLAALPAELAFKILCYLDTTSLSRATRVSQRWRTLAEDDVVWHRMCEQHIDRKCNSCGWGLPLLERKRLRSEKRQIQLRASGRGLDNDGLPANVPPTSEGIPALGEPAATPAEPHEATTSKRRFEDAMPLPECVKRPCMKSVKEVPHQSHLGPIKRPWKDVYKDRYKIGTAWKHGRFSTRVFRGHTNGVMCLQFNDSVLITGSYDATVKVWDINTCEEIRTMTGHASGVRCLQFDDSKLMTGSLDGTLRLWNWKTGQCLRTFNAHTGGVITLHYTRRYVASGSMDKTIRVWEAESKQTFLLRGHSDWINSVKVDEASRTLFSSSDDLTVCMWDLDTRQCIKVFEGHVGQVQQIQLLPKEFELDDKCAPADKDDDASSVSSVSFSHRGTPAPMEPYWPNDPDRPAPPHYMLTGALDSTIRLWDVHSSLEKHAAPPTSASAKPTAAAVMLPTDPLTNSHTPRAQACVRTFFGHVEGIWTLATDHLRMISGAEDRMLKVWDPRTGKCERTFTGHAGPVTCAWLSDSMIASGSEDCEVRLLCFGDNDVDVEKSRDGSAAVGSSE